MFLGKIYVNFNANDTITFYCEGAYACFLISHFKITCNLNQLQHNTFFEMLSCLSIVILDISASITQKKKLL